MHNKLLHRFFSNNDALLSNARTSYIIVKKISIGMFKKNNFLLFLWYGYTGNNLACLGSYPTQ